jgi:hypothetical protein
MAGGFSCLDLLGKDGTKGIRKGSVDDIGLEIK